MTSKLYLVPITILLFSMHRTVISKNAGEGPFITDHSHNRNQVDSNKTYNRLSDLLMYYSSRLGNLEKQRYAQAPAKGDPNLSRQEFRLDSVCYEVMDERNREIYRYITTHKNAEEKLKGMFYLIKSNGIASGGVTVSNIDSLYKTLPTEVQHTAGGKMLNELIQKKAARGKELIYNQAILNLKFETADRKMISIRDVKSKYIFIDFWSSWCGPCRHKNRALARSSDILSNEKITVIAFSLDENSVSWRQANNADQINYLSICDLKGLNSPLAKEFGITSIPQSLIIDKQGNILKRNLWETTLANYISTLP